MEHSRSRVRPNPHHALKAGSKEKMASFRHQAYEKYLKAQKEEQALYLGKPTALADRKLFEARMVIPGNDQIPSRLEDPHALDHIRIKHRVWITNIEPNIFSIQSETMPRLQEALRAMNWALHDMRLSNEHPATRFVVQHPSNGGGDEPIHLMLGSRPRTDRGYEKVDENGISKIVDSLVETLSPTLQPAAETLIGLGKDLNMRVNFGRLNIHQKKQGLEDKFTYEEFERVIKTYGTRGGATLGVSMPDSQRAEKIIAWLLDEANGIHHESDEISHRSSLTLKMEHVEATAEIEEYGGSPQIVTTQVKQFEEWPRMNWTVVAPDSNFDWNIQVDALEDPGNVRSDLMDLVRGIPILPSNDKACPAMLKFPRLGTPRGDKDNIKIDETRLRSWVVIPVKGSRYMINVGVTKTWKGLNIQGQAETTWAMELHGVHWNEALNSVSIDGPRKNWGPGFEYVWPASGNGSSLKERFGDFIKSILQVHMALNDMESATAKDSGEHI